MRFKDSKYFKLPHFRLEKPFGKFYLLDSFFISELNEGVHFNWQMIEIVAKDIVEYYPNNVKIGYISNRVNSYSMDPITWKKVNEKYNMIVVSAIVAYNRITFMNASIEQTFSNNSIRCCDSLDEAIEWITNSDLLN